MPGPTPKPYRPPKVRPINPMDTAGSTGLPVNPNGTYVANPFPTTAQNGSQGQFGAMLPQINVGGLPNAGLSQTPSAYLAQNAHTTGPTVPTAPLVPSDVMRLQNPPTGVPQVQTPAYSTLAERQSATKDFNLALTQEKTAAKSDFENFIANAETTGVPNFDLLPQQLSLSAMNKLNLNAADMQQYGYKIVGGQWVQQNSTQAQTKLQNQQQQYQGNPANTDFMQTGFMQENAANNVSFYNQMRWDPTTGTYQKIGTLIKQGKFDEKTGKAPEKKKKGGGEQQAQQPKPQQPQAQVIGSVTGNFNTAGG